LSNKQGMIFFVAKNYLFLVIKITVHIAHCSNHHKCTVFCNLCRMSRGECARLRENVP